MLAAEEVRQRFSGVKNSIAAPFSDVDFSQHHERDKLRLGQEMDRDLGHYSLNNGSAKLNESRRANPPDDYTHDYSMDYQGPDIDTADSNDFFPRSPPHSTEDLSKHFRDFSMQGVDTSLESVEMPRGAGKEMGSPELSSKDFNGQTNFSKHRPLVPDEDLSAQLHSPSSRARTGSVSDFGEFRRPFSPIEKYGRSGLKDLPSDLDNMFKHATTPGKQQLPGRPRSALMDRYVKTSPPFARPGNPVGKTIENQHRKDSAATTVPRSFKDTTQLFKDLGIDTVQNRHQRQREATPTRNQSFRLPDITGIQSLIDTTPKPTKHNLGKESSSYVAPLSSIPIPRDEKDIISGLRKLQDKVRHLTSENNQQKARVRELENELHHQKVLYEMEKARLIDSEHQILRRSSRDSGFGSVEDSDEALERQKASHAKERMRLQNQMEALKSRIAMLEAQLETEQTRTRSLQEERDAAVEALVTATHESDGLRIENNALKEEIAILKSQYQSASRTTLRTTHKNAKERIKEQVEAEKYNRNDVFQKQRTQPRKGNEKLQNFIKADEIAELQKEIEDIKARQRASDKETQVRNAASSTEILEKVTEDTAGHVQTIRIQLENATDRKTSNQKKLRRRRIQKVIVESSSDDEPRASIESDSDTESSESDERPLPRRANKDIPIQPWLRPPAESSGLNAEIQNIIDGLARHNETSCTVCSRKRRLAKKSPGLRKPLDELDTNEISQPLYHEAASVRPSVPPKQALSSVLEQLQDEFHHLQLQYRALTSEYEALDPGTGKRKRKAIAGKLREVLEEFEAKADQIYALYDVVEGVRLDTLGRECGKGWLEL